MFITDNGPSKAPTNPLVKMWLVCLVHILGIKSITQKSFAEYHSKRNFVEHVHAVHNAALSNEQFSSKTIQPRLAFFLQKRPVRCLLYNKFFNFHSPCKIFRIYIKHIITQNLMFFVFEIVTFLA